MAVVPEILKDYLHRWYDVKLLIKHTQIEHISKIINESKIETVINMMLLSEVTPRNFCTC